MEPLQKRLEVLEQQTEQFICPLCSRVQNVLLALNAQPSLSVSQAAAIVGLSRSRLEHVFKKELGTTIRAYKQERRLARARTLLRDPALRIKEVRHLCGIPDASNFTHLFKQHFGITPNIFRTSAILKSRNSAADPTNK